MDYTGFGPFPGAQGNMLPDAHLSTRTREGWQTVDLTPPTPQVTAGIGASGAVMGYDFSEDLSQVVIKVPGEALTSLPAGSEELFNLFLRKADGSYSLLNTVAPSELTPENDPYKCHRIHSCFSVYDVPAFAGASSDFSRVFFEENGSLIGTGAPGGPTGFVQNLYESSGGTVRLVGFLPDGTIASSGAVPGAGGSVLYSALGPSDWGHVNGAVSANGSRVLFEASADGGGPDSAQSGMTELFDRLEGASTVEVSAPAAGATPANATAEPAEFWAASRDGSQVFFTSSAELTTGSNTGTANNSSDLYRYEVGSGALTDLTIDTNPADASSGAGVRGVVGTSTSGSYVYFVATGQLVAGKGNDGELNLYVSHEGAISFIATLNEADTRDWATAPESQAYVTPDGQHLAFMSVNSLTGYNNLDRSSHQADSEVYEYSAPTQVLSCASCDHNGSPPSGGAFIGFKQYDGITTPFHPLRVLSDDGGRLFFSSPDRLVAEGATPYTKVYENEQAGVGSCQLEGGCVYLMSSPTSGAAQAEDRFLDADATGDNVFIASISRLTSSDRDNLTDVYDVRVNGGFLPATNEGGCTTCAPPAYTSPPSFLPASQLIAGETHGATGSPRKAHVEAKPTCRARAKRVKNAHARKRALQRCPKPKRAVARHGAGR